MSESKEEAIRDAFKRAGIGGPSGRLNGRERERLIALLGRWSEAEAPDGRHRDMAAAIIHELDNDPEVGADHG